LIFMAVSFEVGLQRAAKPTSVAAFAAGRDAPWWAAAVGSSS
jgi:hypothetical protein